MQIDWWTLALQTVNFLVLVWVLQRFLFRPVQRLIETRKARQDELLRAAEGKLAEATAEKARYEKAIADFEAGKEAALKEFQNRLDAERDGVLAKAHAEAEAMIAAAGDEIAEARRQAIAASRADLVALAGDIAARILADRADSGNLQPDLAAAIAKLHALPEQERTRLLDGAASGAPEVVVETAKPLDEDAKGEVTGTLKAEFGPGARVDFEVDPRLLGGLRIRLPQARLDASWATYLDAALARLQEAGHDQGV